jgi:hypothetical protein
MLRLVVPLVDIDTRSVNGEERTPTSEGELQATAVLLSHRVGVNIASLKTHCHETDCKNSDPRTMS